MSFTRSVHSIVVCLLVLWWTALKADSKPARLRPGRAIPIDRSTLTIDGLSVDETSISVLMELKLFPFQSSLVGKAASKSDDEPLHRKRKALLTNGDSGPGSVVAFGINLEIPGESGVGYGEEWPLKSFASSVIGRRISSVFRIRK